MSGPGFWIGGLHEIEVVLRSARRPIFEVVVADGRDSRVSADLEGLAKGVRVPIRKESRVFLDKVFPGVHNGVVARVGERPMLTVGELLEAGTPGSRLLFLLDGVEDPRNFGAILRVAEALGGDGVCVTRDRRAPLSAAAIKASAGASETVRLCELPNLRAAIDRFREAGFWVYGADGEGIPCDSIDFRGDVALVLGAEGRGLRRLTREVVDSLVAVPMSGRVESLNVATAAAILGYEVFRQRRGGIPAKRAKGA